MAARKPATQKATEATEQTQPTDHEGQAIGSVWSFPAAARTSITRPDGAVVDVDPDAQGLVHHVLNIPGDYSAPGVSTIAR